MPIDLSELTTRTLTRHNHVFFSHQRGLSQLKSDWGIGRDERGTYFYRFELTNLFHLQQRKITSVREALMKKKTVKKGDIVH